MSDLAGLPGEGVHGIHSPVGAGVGAGELAVANALADELVARVQRAPERIIVGIAGAPGTGKSTLARAVADRIGDELCCIVPLDGFHLGQSIINGTELESRKGAPDTFDVAGYLTLLTRLRQNSEPVVYAPVYRRDLEEPVAASIAVPASIRIILTEGNYLLLDREPWRGVVDYLDEAWYVDTPDELRRERLIARHIAFGKSPDRARRWAEGPDEVNAQLIEGTRSRARRVIPWHG